MKIISSPDDRGSLADIGFKAGHSAENFLKWSFVLFVGRLYASFSESSTFRAA